MSITEKTHVRFWRTMAERFGKRWLDEYGEQPTFAWRRLLDQHTPADIDSAMDLMRSQGLQHPPTEPQFAQLLGKAQSSARLAGEMTEADWRRGYWRSAIVSACQHAFGYTTEHAAFELLVTDNRALGNAMRELLNDVDALEINTRQRTQGQQDMVERRAREIAAAFHQLKRKTA